jgi:molybdate transport system substrate-binding protein
VRVQPVFGATSELAAQLRAGAPLDLLLSADEAIAQQLASEGLLAALTPLASNRLVVIAREEIAAQIVRPADLAGAAVQRVAMPSAAVPIGRYAREWLGRLGLADAVEARVVRTEHVRATLAAVEGGHADAAIVYARDAQLARSARVAFEIPDAEQPRIAYVAGIASASRQPERAESLLAFLVGVEAGGILRDAGFAPPAGLSRP